MNSGPTLSIGSTGPDVRRLQVLFVMMKEMDYSDIDGTFGPKTQELVKSFQKGSNLTADGIVGPLTWKALPADPNTPRLARGASGNAVSGLQKGLRAFGGANSANPRSSALCHSGLVSPRLARKNRVRARYPRVTTVGGGSSSLNFTPNERMLTFARDVPV
jgi:peptidoglycan hydrolase-like protein with peptidoglycan-binding domain